MNRATVRSDEIDFSCPIIRGCASEAGVPWTYTTNSLNQYTSATESNVQLNFAYDLDGSMTYRPVDSASGWTQVWNGENRMVETYKGTDRLTFKYDYMGRRVEKCVYSGNTLSSKTLYVYDGFKCVEELDALDNNAVVNTYVWQPFGLDVPLLRNVSDFYVSDANKNIIALINANGQLTDTYLYNPFGNCNHIGNSSNPYRFSSEYFYEETRLTYYNFRYNNLKDGRWINRDPIGEKGGFNLYVTVNNDTINKIDSNGNIVAIHNNAINCEIILAINIMIYYAHNLEAEAKTDLSKIAERIKKSIETHWNVVEWRVDCCTLKFQANVKFSNTIDVSKVKGDNLIAISTDPNLLSYVIGNRRGYWHADNRPGSDWSFAHEAGHLMNLPDDYDYDTGMVNPGHEGHMMGQQGGAVTQHEINDIVRINNVRCRCDR